ncbi:hypothetical protein CLU81_0536 [Flavobacterium sp. 9]|uniref:hypothetical protein n=1 Tax=Flavobacterium sp. 9 TaxID=2035198 RepID=UPI000C1A1676|nr:hypothetical protein [Flavobacterium sp. 9]PIF30133.1 hypothetical protein CLU81_0536 [Flavobacterium sp. 9]
MKKNKPAAEYPEITNQYGHIVQESKKSTTKVIIGILFFLSALFYMFIIWSLFALELIGQGYLGGREIFLPIIIGILAIIASVMLIMEGSNGKPVQQKTVCGVLAIFLFYVLFNICKIKA